MVNNWHKLSSQEIADKLNRTLNAVNVKANRVGLRNQFIYKDDVTIHQFLTSILKRKSGGYSYYYQVKLWKKYGMPMYKYTKKKQEMYYMINIPEFIKWFKTHLQLVNLSNSDDGAFGENEPDWLKEKRKADKLASEFLFQRAWTEEETNKMFEMIEKGYGYKDIALELKRTCKAIKRRLKDLNSTKRPVKANVHNKWTQKELNILKDLWLKGYQPVAIMQYIDRTDIAISEILRKNNYFGCEILKYKGGKDVYK